MTIEKIKTAAREDKPLLWAILALVAGAILANPFVFIAIEWVAFLGFAAKVKPESILRMIRLQLEIAATVAIILTSFYLATGITLF